jgi:hypothetical protein
MPCEKEEGKKGLLLVRRVIYLPSMGVLYWKQSSIVVEIF